jgi:hypothetical protein
MPYGDFDLKLGDSDAKATFGGQARVAPVTAQSGAATTTTVKSPAHVTSLQRDLIKLGFRFFDKDDKGEDMPTGTFDLRTEWAVREFQIYAKMGQVAQEDTASKAAEYTDRLHRVLTDEARYMGPVCGVVNTGTRAALTHWLAESWRCPVVIGVWSGHPPKLVRSSNVKYRNLWRYDEVTDGGLVVRALDLSDYYAGLSSYLGTAGMDGAGEMTETGSSVDDIDDPSNVAKIVMWKPNPKLHPEDKRYGPMGDEETAATAMEVLPETTLGQPWEELSPEFRSTFKLVRCVAEIECGGFFDVINAYDGAIMSIGLIHWTLGAEGTGELCGLLDRYARRAAGDYYTAFRFFGFDVRPPEVGAGQKKEPPAVRLQAADGSFVKVAVTEKLNYLRNWHWCYRFVMAMRSFESFRRSMWGEVVARIARIRALPFQDETLRTRTRGGTDHYPTVGEVLTSELSMAVALRWHVIRPANIATTTTTAPKISVAGKTLTDALTQAQKNAPMPPWSSDPSTWTQREEDALTAALRALAAESKIGEIHDSVEMVYKGRLPKDDKAHHWTVDRTKVTALSTARGSFQMAPQAPEPTPEPEPDPEPLPDSV